MSEDLPSIPSSSTLEDVARVAGVSRATVSRVINGIRNVDPDIQEKVRQAISVTGYAPNRAARSLVTRRTGSIALVVSGAGDEGEEDPFPNRVFGDPFFGRVASGVLGFLRPLGMHPVLMLAETAAAREQVISYLRQGNADGALLVSSHAADPLPKLLVDAGLPAVLFARPPRPIPISYVDVAHRAGGTLAADHLVARGCRRVATITGPLDVPASQDRLAGFQETMARHGHPYIPIVEGDFSHDSGETAMQRLMAEHPDVDGVFIANDLMAQGALLVLRDHGRRIPDDVAVVGFDDSSAALACRPQLTTVRQPMEDMAAEMTRLLLSHVEEPERRVTSVIFEPTLVIRQSA
ncbi:LacI family DNA-binding transcriptional regulator [Streptosporangium subroseum]|jgi:DNA-binding LacI/PurR family transcriptional regulator|uniref:Transcriptional regulator, LacI family n=1 Tax=Streptosporangium subroseum TaxID=106412 RepID=A0A239LK32_9ACTN|nr:MULTISPECIES: LacI family DNA-binding transcriptional regulator [Streptosporangium]AWS43243.1 LacI family transcriptional regulator [Streptosporangium sp. 'caverna']WSA13179.1 LacI family transcriptional regulator [Streptosporangium subroseum]SNT29954.1 transcriptional regulator, LacI family [Streptosporangium subroseum]